MLSYESARDCVGNLFDDIFNGSDSYYYEVLMLLGNYIP